MIFHSHKCIYLHVPKSGGTSIMQAFGLGWDHPDTHQMNHAHDNMSSLPNYFRFATVRNPFDRFISGWKYCGFTNHRTITDVLRNLPTKQPVTDASDITTEDFAYHHITVTQRTRLFDLKGQLVPRRLVRYESLQSDFDHLCDMIGKRRVVLPHANSGVRNTYRTYFEAEPEARKLAEEYFKEDLETFGYQY